MENQEWLTVKKASAIVGWSEGTMYNAIARNEVTWKLIPRGREGQKVVLVSSLNKYMNPE